ncbi:glycosyltransferase family 2 protein [Aestuariicoccus sp. MJ-SS9]|uniref:glycosyltransferase family 2 protein n=1 Tax=Aestuariicoccus sp. MJ-SS9 TaxID=3079855 RepID=UPI0029154D14|nr:glycosyltransferase family 2 protein [Aestuariicoccus sp. MJ-SS9]MDU8913927.1 glycosyltransferase family 2 protein [Aestuariicoccus sp. MJ-SS9]
MNQPWSNVPRFDPVHDTPRPLVSVVTAALNAREALRETVGSVAGTSLAAEHVVVDGGSTDGTVDDLAAFENRVKWISEPDFGIADAMNKAIALTRGEWIVVLQAGDSLADPESLESAAEFLSPDIDILLCGVRRGGQAAYRDRSFRFARQRLLFKAIWHQGALCRRDLFEKIGGFDTSFRVAMDYEFFLRARTAGAMFRPAPVILARMDDGGLSSRKDWPSLKARFAEERRAQMMHCQTSAMRAVYAAYWPPYLAYRRLRSRL